jgi:hydroxyisourate hydrolase
MTPVGRTLVDRLPEPEARALLTSCLAAPGWVDGMLAGRPYVDREAVLARGRELAVGLTDSDVESALARHPRIGERAQDEAHDAELSAAEQSGLDAGDAAALAAGNAAYEQRFGRVFLIRAAGRSSRQILDELRRRLGNSDEAERREVAGQLGEIALLRLAALVPEEGDAVAGSTVSTHVLDAALGRPGAGVAVRLERLPDDGAPPEPVGTGTTDGDGRVGELASGVPAGSYRLSFDTAAYFAGTGTDTFFPRVDIVFTVAGNAGHYHVPVLLSPFAFSTYRGS